MPIGCRTSETMYQVRPEPRPLCRRLNPMIRFLLSLALPAAAWACSCAGNGPPCDAAWRASAVFAGTVVELTRDAMQPDSRGIVQANGFFGTHAIFEVAEGFIG